MSTSASPSLTATPSGTASASTVSGTGSSSSLLQRELQPERLWLREPLGHSECIGEPLCLGRAHSDVDMHPELALRAAVAHSAADGSRLPVRCVFTRGHAFCILLCARNASQGASAARHPSLVQRGIGLCQPVPSRSPPLPRTRWQPSPGATRAMLRRRLPLLLLLARGGHSASRRSLLLALALRRLAARSSASGAPAASPHRRCRCGGGAAATASPSHWVFAMSGAPQPQGVPLQVLCSPPSSPGRSGCHGTRRPPPPPPRLSRGMRRRIRSPLWSLRRPCQCRQRRQTLRLPPPPPPPLRLPRTRDAAARALTASSRRAARGGPEPRGVDRGAPEPRRGLRRLSGLLRAPDRASASAACAPLRRRVTVGPGARVGLRSRLAARNGEGCGEGAEGRSEPPSSHRPPTGTLDLRPAPVERHQGSPPPHRLSPGPPPASADPAQDVRGCIRHAARGLARSASPPRPPRHPTGHGQR